MRIPLFAALLFLARPCASDVGGSRPETATRGGAILQPKVGVPHAAALPKATPGGFLSAAQGRGAPLAMVSGTGAEGSQDEDVKSLSAVTRVVRGLRMGARCALQPAKALGAFPGSGGTIRMGWRRLGNGGASSVDATSSSALGDEGVLGAVVGGPAHGSRKKKVLLIMSDTGGGHKASAQAISAALRDLYGDKVDCEICDIWTDYGTWPFNTAVPSYQYLAKHPFLWKLTYEYGRFPVTQWLTQRICSLECWGGIKRCLSSANADMIVSVHPLCQTLPLRVLKHLGGGERKVPFVTVVTDLGGGHPLWFHRKVDACFVPSDVVHKLAKSKGVPESMLKQHGLPIRPGFETAQGDAEKAALRGELGLKHVRTALVVGGGDGVGKLGKIARELAAELGRDGGGQAQVAVVCGKNEVLRQQLMAEDWPENVHVSVQGFVRNMDQWMRAADCIVTKAGPGTIAEACASGLPIMLSAFLPGQEAGNVPFVVDGGFGAYSTKPRVIAKTVSDWLRDPTKLKDMSAKARAHGNPEATAAIAKDIGDLLFAKGGDAAPKPPLVSASG